MLRSFLSRPALSLIAPFLLAACGSEPESEPAPTHTPDSSTLDADVEALTGARTRVVWVRDIGDGDNTFGAKKNNLLMAYDSQDGNGPRAMFEEKGNYYRPLITPDGQRIVFTDFHEEKVYAVNWDGSGLEEIADGSAGALWMDPESGRIWVYGKRTKPNEARHIIRYPIDAPDEEEVLWTRTDSNLGSPGSMQIARDGKTAAMLIPWPVSAVVEFPNGSWTSPVRGCWPGMAPDHSFLSWTFDGSHRRIMMHDLRNDESWWIPISDAPGVDNHEVYHPRWSNHVRFMTMTGPYFAGDGNAHLHAGGPAVNVYVGRFAEDFRDVEQWVQITRDSEFGDFFPDVWVEGGDVSVSRFDPGDAPHPLEIETPEMLEEWPGSTEGLVFLWVDNLKTNRLRSANLDLPPARAEALGEARFGRHYDMHLRRGAVRIEGFDEAIRAACAASGEFTLEATFAAVVADRDHFAPIVSFTTADGTLAFALGQMNDKLVFKLHTDETEEDFESVIVSNLGHGKRHNVLVSYRDSMLTCYLDGRPVMNTTTIRGGLSDWPADAELVFGNNAGGDAPWGGYIEGVAVYDRFIGEEEALMKASLYAKQLEDRDPVPGWEVELKLLDKAHPPAPQAIAPYTRALVVNDYEVVACESDKSMEGEKISVAEWALLDEEVPAYYPKVRKDRNRKILLERFDDHPQLESERLVTDKDILDLDLYYQVFPGA